MKNITLLSVLLFFGFTDAQQLLTDQFNSGSVQNQNGIYIIGEIFNQNYTLSNDETLHESILMINLTGESMMLNEIDFAEIKVYPNPAAHNIYLNSEEQFQMEMYTMNGKMVLKTFGNSIDVSQLPPSVYVLKGISVSGKRFTKKIIVKH